MGEKRQRAILIAGTVIFLVVTMVASVQAVRKAGRMGGALVRWREQAAMLMRGENVYTASGGGVRVVDDDEEANPDNAYPNTPILTLVIYPLMLLPATPSAVLWVLLKAAMVLLVVWWSVSMAAGARRPPPWVYPVVALLAIKPIYGDMTHGNVNILILFVMTAGLVLCYRGRGALGGMVIGLAAAMKVTPALFIVYFLWKRQWRASAGFFAGLIICLLIMPAPLLGWGTNLRLLDAWRDAMISPYVTQNHVEPNQANQSIAGFVHRFLTHVPSIELRGESTERDVNIASLSPEQAQRIVLLVTAALTLVIAWATWPARKGEAWRTAAEYAIILMAMLLISERSWKHHYVTILLPLAVIVCRIALSETTPRQRNWLVGILIFSQLAIYSTSSAATGWLVWVEGAPAGHKYLQALGVYMWTAAALLLSCAWLRVSHEKGPSVIAAQAAAPVALPSDK